MAKEHIKQRPLLYIHQPNFHQSNFKMQTIFISKQSLQDQRDDNDLKDGVNNPVEMELESTVEIMISNEDSKKPLLEDAQNIIEEYNNQHIELNDEQELLHHSQTKPRYSMNRVKSFKEMDINEKINYLINFPTALPPVSCVFTTGDQLIRGIFIGSTEHTIEVKQFDQSKVTLNKDELIDIKMIGY